MDFFTSHNHSFLPTRDSKNILEFLVGNSFTGRFFTDYSRSRLAFYSSAKKNLVKYGDSRKRGFGYMLEEVPIIFHKKEASMSDLLLITLNLSNGLWAEVTD